MEEEYWNKFIKNGQIMDYLYYKGFGICRQVMDRYDTPDEHSGHRNAVQTGGTVESDYGNRYGA